MDLGTREQELLPAEPFDELIDRRMLPKSPVARLYDDIPPETAPWENHPLRFDRRMHHRGLFTTRVGTPVTLLKNVQAPGERHHVFPPDIPTTA
jgi:hypothetical protein